MRATSLTLVFMLIGLSLAAQAPTAKGPNHSPAIVHDADLSYRLPEDWQVIGPKAPAAAQQKKEEQEAPNAEVKKGIACLQVPMTARHGEPPTVVVIVTLPFGCYGETMTGDSLPAFGAAAAEGLSQTFDLSDALTASYRLAGHHMWIERARGVLRGKTGPVYTLEMTCTILKQEAGCWLAQAADERGLRMFEAGAVTLDGQKAPELVPHDLFLHER